VARLHAAIVRSRMGASHPVDANLQLVEVVELPKSHPYHVHTLMVRAENLDLGNYSDEHHLSFAGCFYGVAPCLSSVNANRNMSTIENATFCVRAFLLALVYIPGVLDSKLLGSARRLQSPNCSHCDTQPFR
jgi:hypothetical protein